MLMIPLNQKSSVPMYEQIYEYMKQEILTGSLPFATRLPSSRSLAEQLNISRSTVNSAYAQLLSEGYISAREKSGYFIADIKSLQPLETKPTLSTDTSSRSILSPASNTIVHSSTVSGKKKYTFSPFAVDTASFPYAKWRKLTNNAIRCFDGDALALGDSKGDFSFRQAIAGYLSRSRGVHCTPEQIIVGAGTDYLLMLLCGLLTEHCNIAMENPAYMRAYHVLSGLNKNVIPIPVTDTGVDLTALRASAASVAYVTPSHQYPLGAILPVTKRHELLAWAQEAPDRYIIEDDHDSEYRYKGIPIPSLQSMDTQGKVIYLGTFSRAIAPAIRVSYMVLPTELMQQYQHRFSYYSSTVSRVDQKILTDFINEGHFERHLNKMKTNYHQKHDAMLKALRIFGTDISVSGEHAGLHLVVTFQNGMSEEEIVRRSTTVDITLYSLKEHEIVPLPQKKPAFLFGFAGLTETEIAETISALYYALK